MSQNEFERRIAACLRQLTRLQAVQNGDLKMRIVKVREYRVPAYTVRAHKRMIAGAA